MQGVLNIIPASRLILKGNSDPQRKTLRVLDFLGYVDPGAKTNDPRNFPFKVMCALHRIFFHFSRNIGLELQ